MKTPMLKKLLLLAMALAVVATACGDGDDDCSAVDGPTIRLRGQDFSEAVTIAEVYGQYLQAKGYDVEILTPAGFRTEAIDGLRNDELDLIVDYIGGSLTALAAGRGDLVGRR